jgi:hypothetical protein
MPYITRTFVRGLRIQTIMVIHVAWSFILSIAT